MARDATRVVGRCYGIRAEHERSWCRAGPWPRWLDAIFVGGQAAWGENHAAAREPRTSAGGDNCVPNLSIYWYAPYSERKGQMSASVGKSGDKWDRMLWIVDRQFQICQLKQYAEIRTQPDEEPDKDSD